MTQTFRRICACQFYKLKGNAQDLFGIFSAHASPQATEISLTYAKQFLRPTVKYEKHVGSAQAVLTVCIAFSPKQCLDRAKNLLATTQMSKTAKSFVQKDRGFAEKFLKEDAKYPPSLYFALTVEDESDSGFDAELIRRVLENKSIKANLDSLLRKVYHRSLYGNLCPTLMYDSSEFETIGGLIPSKLPVPRLISKNLGEPSLNSITLGFRGSPIGLEEVLIEKVRGQLCVELEVSRKINDFHDIYPRAIKEVRQIADLLIRKVS